MNFTIWTLGAVVAAGQGLFLAVVLFVKRENRQANRWLGAMLLLLAATLSEWVLWWTGLIRQAPALKAVGVGFPLLYGPFMFLFYREVFERTSSHKKTAGHFLPFALTIFFLLPFYLRFFPTLAGALQWIPPLTRKPWFPIFIFTQMIAYGLWIPVRFKPYFLENKALRTWHRWLLTAYGGIVATYLLYRLLPLLGLTAPEWVYLIAGSLTVFIYFVAWWGYLEPRVFAGEALREAIQPAKYRNSPLQSNDSARLFNKIETRIQEERLYLDESLTLDALAQRIEEPRHRISQAINEQSGKSFSELVNGHRIREAQQLLETTTKQELNIIEIAYQVGFSSKKTFNAVFKKHTGMTPTEFRRSSVKEG